MKPLQWYFDYEPKGYQPRKDRRFQNHQARQQARREIAIEVEALARENAPETVVILACVESRYEAERIRQEEDYEEFRRLSEHSYDYDYFDDWQEADGEICPVHSYHGSPRDYDNGPPFFSE